MIVTLQFVLMVLALICFLLSALGVTAPRVELKSAGLFLWALAATLAMAH